MENERDRQLREAARFHADSQYATQIVNEGNTYIRDVAYYSALHFAKSEAAKQYWQEQFKQPVKTLEEVGLSYNENNGLGVVFGKDLDYIKLHKWTPDQLRAIANHIEQTNKTPTK